MKTIIDSATTRQLSTSSSILPVIPNKAPFDPSKNRKDIQRYTFCDRDQYIDNVYNELKKEEVEFCNAIGAFVKDLEKANEEKKNQGKFNEIIETLSDILQATGSRINVILDFRKGALPIKYEEVNSFLSEISQKYNNFALLYESFCDVLSSYVPSQRNLSSQLDIITAEKNLLKPFQMFLHLRYFLWRVQKEQENAEYKGLFEILTQSFEPVLEVTERIFRIIDVRDSFMALIDLENTLNAVSCRPLNDFPSSHKVVLDLTVPTSLSYRILKNCPDIVCHVKFTEVKQPKLNKPVKKLKELSVVLLSDTVLVKYQQNNMEFPPVPLGICTALATDINGEPIIEFKLRSTEYINIQSFLSSDEFDSLSGKLRTSQKQTLKTKLKMDDNEFKSLCLKMKTFSPSKLLYCLCSSAESRKEFLVQFDETKLALLNQRPAIDNFPLRRTTTVNGGLCLRYDEDGVSGRKYGWSMPQPEEKQVCEVFRNKTSPQVLQRNENGNFEWTKWPLCEFVLFNTEETAWFALQTCATLRGLFENFIEPSTQVNMDLNALDIPCVNKLGHFTRYKLRFKGRAKDSPPVLNSDGVEYNPVVLNMYNKIQSEISKAVMRVVHSLDESLLKSKQKVFLESNLFPVTDVSVKHNDVWVSLGSGNIQFGEAQTPKADDFEAPLWFGRILITSSVDNLVLLETDLDNEACRVDKEGVTTVKLLFEQLIRSPINENNASGFESRRFEYRVTFKVETETIDMVIKLSQEELIKSSNVHKLIKQRCILIEHARLEAEIAEVANEFEATSLTDDQENLEEELAEVTDEFDSVFKKTDNQIQEEVETDEVSIESTPKIEESSPVFIRPYTSIDSKIDLPALPINKIPYELLTELSSQVEKTYSGTRHQIQPNVVLELKKFISNTEELELGDHLVKERKIVRTISDLSVTESSSDKPEEMKILEDNLELYLRNLVEIQNENRVTLQTVLGMVDKINELETFISCIN